ncbi:DUF6163 family protein [Salinarimonas ramus]|uniref:Uncharacterized protein n=1 Tax=Salinarimonas ramus TaxID=690164 RepID=A0A917V4X4_9HYPH|nr:DUF6163 family protein [Salinarimonas ramus]GGK37931.1 hypothetical protein GCM10011322_26240 [Salinarimonas ramus]
MWPFRRRGAPAEDRSPEPSPADAALRLSEPSSKAGLRWQTVLTWFMRLMALLWIAKGLSFWAVIVGAGDVAPPFQDRSLGFQATVVYFAVIDPIAAVGLWLTATWGGVLWLLAVMSHLILALFFPGVVPVSLTLAVAYCALMVTYLLISYLASGEDG